MNLAIISLYLLGILLSVYVLYLIIKFGVRDGMLEANNKKIGNELLNPFQVELQRKYENGEISFETYKSEWNK
jgi:hypothetical protein